MNILLHPIFPTTVGEFYLDEIPHNLLNDISQLKETELEVNEYYDMIVSKSKNVLENNKNLKDFILDLVVQYAKNCLGINKRMRITQSWISKQSSNTSLFPHRHQNSIISGVYYLNKGVNQSGLKFYKDNDLREKYIDWFDETHTDNEHNYQSYTINAKESSLLLFPSHLKHGVTENQYNENRLSLAFNTWFDEKIGSEENLNLL
jgi:uncharacterized protein (TIGR02466 family)